MTTLANFLMTGQLGPIVLGLTPLETITILGDADVTSKKSNPLLLRYGPLQLTFVKGEKGPGKSTLNRIGLHFQPPVIEPFPEIIQPTDLVPQGSLTETEFRIFLHSINYLPVHRIDGEHRRHLIMQSGVHITFSEERLFSIVMSEKEVFEIPQVQLNDEREPSKEQVHEMLLEAELAMEAGAKRSSLLIAWAAIEAMLRRKAIRAGLQGRVGVSPHALIRELQAKRLLAPEEFRFLEKVRSMRMAAAHGLVPISMDVEFVRSIIVKAKAMLEELY